MTRLSDEQLQALSELEKKATAGNWLANEEYHCVHTHSRGIPLFPIARYGEIRNDEVNFNFIAESRNSMRALLDEVIAYRKAVKEIEAQRERYLVAEQINDGGLKEICHAQAKTCRIVLEKLREAPSSQEKESE